MRFAAALKMGKTARPKIRLHERRVMYIGIGTVLLIILIIVLIAFVF